MGGGEEPDAPPLFSDVTAAVGLAFVHDPGVDGAYYYPEIIGSGGGFLDFDGDGDLDVYLVNGARRPHAAGGPNPEPLRNRLYRQEADGSFVDVTDRAGVGDTGFGMGLATGDIDNDGDVDLYVTNVGGDVLYRNEGDGTFTDVTRAAGLADTVWGASATMTDVDGDGWLDLYVTNYVVVDTAANCTDLSGQMDYCGPAFYLGVPDLLYRNRGDGRFDDVSARSGIAAVAAAGLGVVAADFSGDGHQDIYVANDGEPNQLWVNLGDGTFEDQALEYGVAVSALGRAEAGMGVAIGDPDGDADLDLLLTHLRGEANRLYVRGPHAFEDGSFRAGLAGPSTPFTGFGTGFVDIDHDGDQDLLVVNGRVLGGPMLVRSAASEYWDPYAEPNLVFLNDGAGRFDDVSAREPMFVDNITNSRGLAFGDVDSDGDIDLLITNGGGEARLLVGRGAELGHWLLVRAHDPEWSRDAVGAVVTVVSGGRAMHRLVTTGYSYLASHDPRVHFGLGTAATVDEIRVRWPDGSHERFPGGSADRVVEVAKGTGERLDG